MKTKVPEMTERETQIYHLIQKNKRTVERLPTVRELCKLSGLKSTATVQQYLERLREKGYL